MAEGQPAEFWSSVELAGNQTLRRPVILLIGFGAVSNWLVIKPPQLCSLSTARFGAVSNWLVIKLAKGVVGHPYGFGAVSN